MPTKQKHENKSWMDKDIQKHPEIKFHRGVGILSVDTYTYSPYTFQINLHIFAYILH